MFFCPAIVSLPDFDIGEIFAGYEQIFVFWIYATPFLITNNYLLLGNPDAIETQY